MDANVCFELSAKLHFCYELCECVRRIELNMFGARSSRYWWTDFEFKSMWKGSQKRVCKNPKPFNFTLEIQMKFLRRFAGNGGKKSKEIKDTFVVCSMKIEKKKKCRKKWEREMIWRKWYVWQRRLHMIPNQSKFEGCMLLSHSHLTDIWPTFSFSKYYFHFRCHFEINVLGCACMSVWDYITKRLMTMKSNAIHNVRMCVTWYAQFHVANKVPSSISGTRFIWIGRTLQILMPN